MPKNTEAEGPPITASTIIFSLGGHKTIITPGGGGAQQSSQHQNTPSARSKLSSFPLSATNNTPARHSPLAEYNTSSHPRQRSSLSLGHVNSRTDEEEEEGDESPQPPQHHHHRAMGVLHTNTNANMHPSQVSSGFFGGGEEIDSVVSVVMGQRNWNAVQQSHADGSGWTVREQLLLAQAVFRAGEGNWAEVSRALRPNRTTDRPWHWFSAQNCDKQYSHLCALLRQASNMDTDLTARRGTEGTVEALSRVMFKARIAELKQGLRKDRTQYRQQVSETNQIARGLMDTRLDAVAQELHAEGVHLPPAPHKDVHGNPSAPSLLNPLLFDTTLSKGVVSASSDGPGALSLAYQATLGGGGANQSSTRKTSGSTNGTQGDVIPDQSNVDASVGELTDPLEALALDHLYTQLSRKRLNSLSSIVIPNLSKQPSPAISPEKEPTSTQTDAPPAETAEGTEGSARGGKAGGASGTARKGTGAKGGQGRARGRAGTRTLLTATGIISNSNPSSPIGPGRSPQNASFSADGGAEKNEEDGGEGHTQGGVGGRMGAPVSPGVMGLEGWENMHTTPQTRHSTRTKSALSVAVGVGGSSPGHPGSAATSPNDEVMMVTRGGGSRRGTKTNVETSEQQGGGDGGVGDEKEKGVKATPVSQLRRRMTRDALASGQYIEEDPIELLMPPPPPPRSQKRKTAAEKEKEKEKEREREVNEEEKKEVEKKGEEKKEGEKEGEDVNPLESAGEIKEKVLVSGDDVKEEEKEKTEREEDGKKSKEKEGEGVEGGEGEKGEEEQGEKVIKTEVTTEQEEKEGGDEDKEEEEDGEKPKRKPAKRKKSRRRKPKPRPKVKKQEKTEGSGGESDGEGDEEEKEVEKEGEGEEEGEGEQSVIHPEAPTAPGSPDAEEGRGATRAGKRTREDVEKEEGDEEKEEDEKEEEGARKRAKNDEEGEKEEKEENVEVKEEEEENGDKSEEEERKPHRRMPKKARTLKGKVHRAQSHESENEEEKEEKEEKEENEENGRKNEGNEDVEVEEHTERPARSRPRQRSRGGVSPGKETEEESGRGSEGEMDVASVKSEDGEGEGDGKGGLRLRRIRSDKGSQSGDRVFKKQMSDVWEDIRNHRYGNTFLQAVTARDAPNYRRAVRRPMDLTNIKKRVESGVTTSPTEFLRDCLLMCANAIMFNAPDHHIHQYAQEIRVHARTQVERFVMTQMLVQSSSDVESPVPPSLRHSFVIPARKAAERANSGGDPSKKSQFSRRDSERSSSPAPSASTRTKKSDEGPGDDASSGEGEQEGEREEEGAGEGEGEEEGEEEEGEENGGDEGEEDYDEPLRVIAKRSQKRAKSNSGGSRKRRR